MVAHKNQESFFFRSPDLCSEANAVLNAAKAKVAWTAIQQGLWQQRRKGTTEAKVASQMNRLTCGIRQLAANEGVDVVTMRRQCRRLAAAGFIRIIEEVPQLVHHPVTGRLVSRKSKGPIKPVVIVVTVQPYHRKPATAEEAKARKAEEEAGTAWWQSPPKAWVRSAPTTGTLEVQCAPTTWVRSAPTSESLKEFKTKKPPDGHADGFGRPQAAEGEKDTAGLEAGEYSLEKGDVPAVEAIAGTDTASEPSWGYATAKAPRSFQNATGEAKRPWTPKTHTQASGDQWRPEGSMPVGESFGSRRFYRADSQISQTDAEYAAWRQERLAAAQTAASEAAAAVLAIRPTRAKMAASGCRMAASTAG